jgi:uncharacterized iron-regulated membrane protein
MARKILGVAGLVLGILMMLGGLVLPGLVVAFLAVWLWPRKRKARPSAKDGEPIWARTDRETSYFAGDSSGD